MTLAQKVGLAAAFVVIIALGSHVNHWSGIGGLLTPLVVIGAAGTLLFVGVRRVGGRGAYRMAVHTHGGHGTWTAAKHEAGHYHQARAVGGSSSSAQIFPDGSGVTWVDVPRSAGPAAAIAVCVAGAVAAGTRQGCDYGKGSDFHEVRRILKELPRSDRRAVEREGWARARRDCNGLFSPVPGLAKRIYRNGSI